MKKHTYLLSFLLFHVLVDLVLAKVCSDNENENFRHTTRNKIHTYNCAELRTIDIVKSPNWQNALCNGNGARNGKEVCPVTCNSCPIVQSNLVTSSNPSLNPTEIPCDTCWNKKDTKGDISYEYEKQDVTITCEQLLRPQQFNNDEDQSETSQSLNAMAQTSNEWYVDWRCHSVPEVRSSCPESCKVCSHCADPTAKPSSNPSVVHSSLPSAFPSTRPTSKPTSSPTMVPSNSPSVSPTAKSSLVPSSTPTRSPAAKPSHSPTLVTSSNPTSTATEIPCDICWNKKDTKGYIFYQYKERGGIITCKQLLRPQQFNNDEDKSETSQFFNAMVQTSNEWYVDWHCHAVPKIRSSCPESCKICDHCDSPTPKPSPNPSVLHSLLPSAFPSSSPTSKPTSSPTMGPSNSPSVSPTTKPSVVPTATPTRSPTVDPSSKPTLVTSSNPTSIPTEIPCDICWNKKDTKGDISYEYQKQKATITCEQLPRPQQFDADAGIMTKQFLNVMVQTSNEWYVDWRCYSVPKIRSSCPESCKICDHCDSPTPKPSPNPSADPTSKPSTSPMSKPSATPTSIPTSDPSLSVTPTAGPSLRSSSVPSNQPSLSASPSEVPTSSPTMDTALINECFSLHSNLMLQKKVITAEEIIPFVQCYNAHSYTPSTAPSFSPTFVPTLEPSNKPTTVPTSSPSLKPSAKPSTSPTSVPSGAPSSIPTLNPTSSPSLKPSAKPSTSPTSAPTGAPSSMPTLNPTTTQSPSSLPSLVPSLMPSSMPSISLIPTSTPTTSMMPSAAPTKCTDKEDKKKWFKYVYKNHPPKYIKCANLSNPFLDSRVNEWYADYRCYEVDIVRINCPVRCRICLPSEAPSNAPSTVPTLIPSEVPSHLPTVVPTEVPSVTPTATPSQFPSLKPSPTPSTSPTSVPSETPSSTPTLNPTTTQSPSSLPTVGPSLVHSTVPSLLPSSAPSPLPSMNPTSLPTSAPSVTSSSIPSESMVPTSAPSDSPTLSAAPTACSKKKDNKYPFEYKYKHYRSPQTVTCKDLVKANPLENVNALSDVNTVQVNDWYVDWRCYEVLVVRENCPRKCKLCNLSY